MKKRLFRWENCFLPLACLIGALLGQEALAIRFFAAQSIISLFTMCADGAFCIDAARQGSLRQVDRRFCGSIVQIAIGALVAGFAGYWYLKGDVWLPAAGLLCAALLACITQLHVERLHAHNQRRDARILALLQALLAIAGFGLDTSFPVPGKALCLALLAGAIIANAALLIAPCRGFSAVPRCYARAPQALWQNMLYPAAVCIAALAHGKMPPAIPVLAGWVLWRGARTVCRRSESESAPLCFWIAAICGAANIAALFIPQLRILSAYLTLAMLCIVIVFAHFSLRTAIATLLLIAAALLPILNPLPQIPQYIIGSLFSILPVGCADRHLLPRI